MAIDYRTRTGLVVVDPFNDMLADAGKVWPRVQAVAERLGTREHLRTLVTAARAAGIPVVIAPHRRWRPGDFDGWQQLGGLHRGVRDGHLFGFGAFGGDWYPGLAPVEGDITCGEHWGMNAFVGTDLDLLLRQHGVDNVVLAGMTAPGCVEGTGRMCTELGYATTLVRDATAAYTDDLLRASHELIGPLYAHAIVTTADVVTHWQTA